MRSRSFACAIAIALAIPLSVAASSAVRAQGVERGVAVVSEEAASQIPAFSYREGPESELAFRGTSLVPAGEGGGEVEFQNGRARIGMNVRKLPDPWSLGPYAIYVLWAITLEGRPSNLGSLEVRGGRAILNTSAPLAQFALIVTAEPHFAVTAPSKAVVLQNFARNVKGRQDTVRTLAERADYSGLARQSIDARGRVPLDLYQARYAMAIAKAVNAAEFAPQSFARAEALFKKAEAAQASKRASERRTVAQTARDVVQAAEDSRREALIARAATEQKTREQQQAAAAEAEAQRRAAAAEEEGKRRLAAAEAEQQRQAQLAAEEAKRREAAAAQSTAATAALQARAELAERLNRALPTTDTERGLVAQISGVQFASGGAALSAAAREALARFAGVVLAYPEMRFVVEGHTDNVGNEKTNTALSLKRAIKVRDYLIGQGVPASSIDVNGLGPTAPVADNATPAGRAANRRVEIVMSGGPVGSGN